MRQLLSICGLLLFWTWFNSALCFAQRVEFSDKTTPKEKTQSSSSTPLKAENIKTIIELEVIVPANGTASLHAQQWGKKLQDVGISPIFRTPRAGDGTVMDEKRIGQTRMIRIHATLDSSGKLAFPNQKSFTLDNSETFVEWIHEIEAYGIQGKPEGQPMWGLTKPQFEAVFTKLAVPLEVDTQGKTFTEALKPWENLPQFPLVISAGARDILLARSKLQLVKQNVKGITLGTALAILLSEYELCFYPERTANGNFQLRIEPQADFSTGWPIGYTLESRDLLRQKVAPQMFKLAEVYYQDKPLDELIRELETQTTVKFFVNYAELAQKSIELNKVLIKIPYKQNTPSLIIKSACIQGKLTQELMVDEINKPFIWITPFTPQPVEK